MLTQQRKQTLLDLLSRDGRIIAKDCAAQLNVSDDTIRRDLRSLADAGLLLRVHGGALPISRAAQDLSVRADISIPEKQALGAAGAMLVQPRKVVFLDGGTTTLELARALPKDLSATIVTHSPTIASELVDHHLDVHLIGGRLFKHSMVAVGALAVEAIQRIRADIYFMGVTGIHPDLGFSTGDAEEAAIKRSIADISAEIIVMASSEKLGTASPYMIAPTSVASKIIVPKDRKKMRADWINALGPEIAWA